MTLRMEYEACDGGIRLTSVSTMDRTIDLPRTVDGRPVVAVGSRFLNGSKGTHGRVLRIPASVVAMESDALEGTTGISKIEYEGDVATFSGFGVSSTSDCRLECGDGFSFDFKGGSPMGFPEFDRFMLVSAFGLTLETAVARLNDPVLLTDENRDGYRRFVSQRIMPRADHAVVSGDTGELAGLISTGMIDDEGLRTLLGRSARSGKVAVTSMLMSVIRSRSQTDEP
ncbi:MAG: hypothetical protein IJ856_03360 [Candidatus Methanomethylophilaceae archaeon]|nr:hypothetical protein [Candidatus Methanomethylophilaceae archaeon]